MHPSSLISPALTILNNPPQLRLNHNPHRLRLRNHTPTQPLQTQPTQPQLRLLDLRNLIHMLKADRLPHNPIVIPSPLQLALLHLHPCRHQQQVRRRRRAELEVEAAVWPHGDARGDRDPGLDVRRAGVELLRG